MRSSRPDAYDIWLPVLDSNGKYYSACRRRAKCTVTDAGGKWAAEIVEFPSDSKTGVDSKKVTVDWSAVKKALEQGESGIKKKP
jgi:hypothetical protein